MDTVLNILEILFMSLFFLVILALMFSPFLLPLYMLISSDCKQKLKSKGPLCIMIGAVADASRCGEKANSIIKDYLNSCFDKKQTEAEVRVMMKVIETVPNLANKSESLEQAIMQVKELLSKKKRTKFLNFLCEVVEKGDNSAEGWNLIMYLAERLDVSLLKSK